MKRIIFQILMVVSLLDAIPAGSFAQTKIQRGNNTKKTTTKTVKKAGDATPKHTGTSAKSNTAKKHTAQHSASNFNFEITDVSFANTDLNGKIIDPYDSKLYAKEVMFLRPRITYKSKNADSKDVTIYVKIFDESGKLSKGSTSPEGYSYSDKLQPKTTTSSEYSLSGWGTANRSTYSSGVYRFEFWIDGTKNFEKSVRLYSGAQPIVDNSFFKINSASICSTDENNTVQISSPENFYSGDVKYLTTKINYTGLSKNEQTIPVYVRIINSNGTLMGGDKSPEGFTYKTNVTIKPGVNTLQFSGWGNSAGGAYKPGDVRLEYWLDGEKIHEGHAKIKSNDEKGKNINVSGHVNGYECVDLGLPSGKKWASMNVGATSPYNAGTFYNWGKTYSYRKNDSELRLQEDISGNSSYDVARSVWGGSWRLPTSSEWKELFDNCKATKIEEHGMEGVKLTGKNGASIILPRCGWLTHGGETNNPTVGFYWTSTPSNKYNFNAGCVKVFQVGGMIAAELSKQYGMLVRPITD